jgi:hypothetical protein
MSSGNSDTLDELIENLRQNNVDMTNLMQKLPGWFPDVFRDKPELYDELRKLWEAMCRRTPPGC